MKYMKETSKRKIPAKKKKSKTPKEKAVLDIVAEEKIKRLQPFVVRRAPSPSSKEDSYVCVTLTYRADPKKDSIEWLTAQAARMPDQRAVRREFLLDWTSAEGSAFYPNFADAPERFVSSDVTFDPKRAVYRGFDFGFRHPACVWMQTTEDGRIHVLHDLLPSDIDSHSFRDLVLFLSGQSLHAGTSYDVGKELARLGQRPRAYQYAVRYIKDSPWWTPAGSRQSYHVPFFPPGTRFFNFSGPEAYRINATVESNRKERTDAEVFESAGIYLDIAYQSVEAGETLIRKSLLDRGDGKPGFMCSPAAVNTIDALGGGVVYASPSKVNPRPDTASKDGLYEHVHDSIRYAITHIVDSYTPLPVRAEPSNFRESDDMEDWEAAQTLHYDEAGNSYEASIDWNDLDSFVK